MTLFTLSTLSDDLFSGLTLEAELADGGGLSLREAIGLANTGLFGAVDIELSPDLDGPVQVREGALSIGATILILDLSVDPGAEALVLEVLDGGTLSLDDLVVDGDLSVVVHDGGMLGDLHITTSVDIFFSGPELWGSGGAPLGLAPEPEPEPEALGVGTITGDAEPWPVEGGEEPLDPNAPITLTARIATQSTGGGAPDLIAAPAAAAASTGPAVVTVFDDQLFDGGTLAAEQADGGGLSLREAIGLANAGGASEIVISDAIAGQSVQLTHGELLLTADMTITGDLALDGRGLARVMHAASGTSTLTGLTLTDGAAAGMGGGLLISAGAAITLNDVKVTDNTATDGAGGIHVATGGWMRATDTAVTGNTTSGYGGGMIVNGIATMVNAEIGENTATRWGGGVDLDLGGSLTLINATVHGNTAVIGGGGVNAWSGALTVDASTFTGNTAGGRGGAIYMSAASDSVSSLADSIFAGNDAANEISGRDLFLAGTDVNFGDNIVLGAAARTATGTFALTGANSHELESDGVALSDVFAQIDGATGGGRVADNGGAARTAALTLDPTNIAIGGGAALDGLDLDGDALIDDPLPFGANGASRETIIGSDIGAFQTELLVTSALDVTDLTDGVTTLREAIEFAGLAGGTHQITFDADVFAGGKTIALTEGQMSVFSAMFIDGDVDGDGIGDVTLDAGGLSRVLGLTAGGDAVLNGVNFVGGAASSGGAIHMVGASMLTLTRSTVSGNAATGNGGGIEVNTGATLHARDVVVANNSASNAGGGVQVYGDVVLVNAEISANTANFGGAIEVGGGTLELTNATVHGNFAAAAGGGVDAYVGAVTITSSTITGNSTSGGGGGLYVGSGMVATVTNTIVAGNFGSSGEDAYLRSDVATGGGLIFGTAAFLYTGVTNPSATIAAAATLFAVTDAAGGGVASDNGGFGDTIALLRDAANLALGGAVTDAASVAADTLDLDYDGNVTERLPQDAAGAPRDWINPDVGALEAAGVDTPSLLVTTALDVVDENDGLISLREAVAAANSGALTGTITFDMSLVDQVLVLTGGEIVLTGDVAIDGDIVGDGLDHDLDGVVDIFDRDGVADIHIDGGGAGRIFNIDGGSADLHGLILENGDAGDGYGGAIRVRDGALAFSNGQIRDSVANFGGGLYGFGADITLVNTEIRDNSAVYGGGAGVWSSQLSMANVTIAENDASSGAGGLLSIQNSVDLTNLTVAGNDAGADRGGIWFYQNDGSMVQSTVTGNVAAGAAGGVQVDGASAGLVLVNSIIAANVGGAGAADLQVVSGGAATLAGAVLLGAAADVDAGSSLTMDGTLLTLSQMAETIEDVFSIEPGGSPALFDAGGFVRTVSLKVNPGNRALAAGDPALLPADIHDLDGDGDVAEALPIGANGGEIRAGAPDLGAAALPPFVDVPWLVVTTTSDVTNPWDGQVTLREAIAWVNDGTLTGTITFADGAGEAFEGGGTIALNGTELLLTQGAVTIDGDLDGDGTPDVTLDAGGLSRVLHIAPVDGGPTVIAGLVITGGVAADGGGVQIDQDAGVRFYDAVITGNTATGAGGEDGRGGGVFINGADGNADALFFGGAITGNSAGLGGGLALEGGAYVDVFATLIADNAASQFGGGVIAISDGAGASGQLIVINATIANNFGGKGGGAIGVGAGVNSILLQSTVTGNDAVAGAGLMIIDEDALFAANEGLPPPAFIDCGTIYIGQSIVAGNGASPAREITTHDPSRVLINGAGAVIGDRLFNLSTLSAADPAIVTWTADDGTVVTPAPVILSQRADLDLSDIFDAIDPATGGGLLAGNGGLHHTVAIKADFDNPAIDKSGVLAADLAVFGPGDPDWPEDGFIYFDADGAPRESAFVNPTLPGAMDWGAVEAVRQTAADIEGQLPAGAPTLADLSVGAGSMSDAAAAFDNAAFVNFGADDRLVFEGASAPSQFSFDGEMLIYDADGDGEAEAKTFVDLAPDAADLTFTATGGGVSVTAMSAPNAIGEVVQLTVGTSWQTLSFANTYQDAVVFALAPSLNEAESVATRFKNISATGAEIRLQEPKSLYTGASNRGDHVDETVTLVVLEKGVHTLEDGTIIQVGALETSKLYVKGFETVAFDDTFSVTPSIFSQVQTLNGTDFIISRQRSPDAGGFELTMQEEQADNLNHAAETVGWFAIEGGNGALSTMDWRAGSSAQNVNGNLTPVHFGFKFDEKPLVMAALASYNGTDTSSPRIGAVNKNAFTAMALEDQSHDEETLHGMEIVDWMAFSNAGTIFGGDPVPVAGGRQIAASGFAETGAATITVDFGSAFDNPVVIATMTSRNGAQEAIARVSDVTSTGFDLRIQETDALDGNHGTEQVSWIVVEAGTWTLADGTILQAGLEDVGISPRQGFGSVTFDAAFTADPAVLSQTQTDNDAAFVKTRMKTGDVAGFQVALEEEEAASWGSHATETVGWLAVDMGLASDIDGFVFEAGEISASHGWKTEAFTGPFVDAPGVVAGMATFNASDTAGTRMRALDAAGFDIHVEEDSSLNAETGHGTETFHWIAFDGDGALWGDALL